jgi:hypothetical protein
MAEPTIKNGEEHFFMTLYEGNGAGQKVGNFVPFTDNGTVTNSCIFDRASTAALIRTPSSDGNKGVFTISFWYKPTGKNYGIFLYASSADDAWNSASSAGLYHDSYKLKFYSSGTTIFETTRTLEDTSKWYHILVANDSSQSGTDKIKLYIDGDQVTAFNIDNRSSVPTNSIINTQIKHNVGGQTTTGTTNAFIDASFAEYNFVDGAALTPSTFGVTDTSTGRWIPKALTGITYGTNGFRLQFASSSNLGDDTSGNNNDLSVQNLVAGDQTTDSPTQNFATFDQYDQGNNNGSSAGTATLAEGNTRVTAGSNPSNWDQYRTSKPLLSGKYYVEVTLTSLNTATYFGVISKNQSIKNNGWYSDQKTGWSYDSSNGKTENSNNGYISYGGARSQGDVVGIAVDLDNGKLWFSENGTYPNSGNPATGANPAYSNLKLAVQDGGLCFTEARGYSGHNDWNFGQKSYTHSAPSGFSTVQQDNMPETVKGVSGLVWIKDRDSASYSHFLFDSSRGQGNALKSNSANAVSSYNPNELKKFLKGGYSVGSSTEVNRETSYVAWNWVCNGGTTETNNDGETTVTLQKNTTAGFSIGTFTSKVAEQTCGHGLGVKPDFILLKKLDGSQNWMAYHSALSSSDAYYLHLNNTDTTQTGSDFGNDVPTSTVFHTNVTGTAGSSYCFWAWRSVEGYSKFGLYEGNNNTDGTFVYTGFKPAWLMIKDADNTRNWIIIDNARDPFNPTDKGLAPSNTNAENTGNTIDFLSNGFKFRSSSTSFNTSSTYIYIAFAEHPFVGDGTNPVTAR